MNPYEINSLCLSVCLKAGNKKSFTDDAASRLLRGMIALASNDPKTFVSRRKVSNNPRPFFPLLTAHPPLGGPGGITNTLDVRFPSVSSFEDVSTIEATGQGCLRLGVLHSASTHKAA